MTSQLPWLSKNINSPFTVTLHLNELKKLLFENKKHNVYTVNKDSFK